MAMLMMKKLQLSGALIAHLTSDGDNDDVCDNDDEKHDGDDDMGNLMMALHHHVWCIDRSLTWSWQQPLKIMSAVPFDDDVVDNDNVLIFFDDDVFYDDVFDDDLFDDDNEETTFETLNNT